MDTTHGTEEADMPIQFFTAVGSGELPNEALPEGYGDPITFITEKLEEDPGLLDSCVAPYLAMNESQNTNPGIFQQYGNAHPGTRIAQLLSCNSDLSVEIGYGDHVYPTLTGTPSIRHRTPDLIIEDLDTDMCDWNRVLPVVEGYVCRPVKVDDRVFVLDGARHCLVGTQHSNQISVLDLSEFGDVACVPFSSCTVGDDVRDLTVNPSTSLEGKSVFAIIQGRVIHAHDCIVQGQHVHVSVTPALLGARQTEDVVLHGGLSPHHSVYYPTHADSQYIYSEEFLNGSFLVVVDSTKHYVYNANQGILIGRHKFTFNGLASGILQNLGTGLLCHTALERWSPNQTTLVKAGRKFYPNHSVGNGSAAIHPYPTDSAEILIDSDMGEHGLMNLFTIQEDG